MTDGKKERILLCAGLSIVMALGLAFEIIRVPMKIDGVEMDTQPRQVSLNEYISYQIRKK